MVPLDSSKAGTKVGIGNLTVRAWRMCTGTETDDSITETSESLETESSAPWVPWKPYIPVSQRLYKLSMNGWPPRNYRNMSAKHSTARGEAEVNDDNTEHE